MAFARLQDALPFVEPDTSKWGISRLVDDKDDFLKEVVTRVVHKMRILYPTTRNLYDELANTLYQERIRVTTSRWKSDPTDEIYPAWFDVASRSGHGCGWKGAGSPVAARVAR